jgi:tetratricopeptide (TPR) repeat protein
VLQQSQGNLQAAATLYREVLATRSDFAEAWLNLGNVLFALGDLEQSRECWRAALEKQPDLSTQFLPSSIAA